MRGSPVMKLCLKWMRLFLKNFIVLYEPMAIFLNMYLFSILLLALEPGRYLVALFGFSRTGFCLWSSGHGICFAFLSTALF